MQIEDLDFDFPDRLIATERAARSRILFVDRDEPRELPDLKYLLSEIAPGDCLVINDSRVLKRRVFSASDLEILFIAPLDPEKRRWQVLCPSSRWKDGEKQKLPDGVTLRLLERGRMQTVESDKPLAESFFEAHGEMPLPPYIQKARGERHNRGVDDRQYQTKWARRDGSLAAPTASLHFSDSELEVLRDKGVRVLTITLHVGLGTFLPITVKNLDEHVMHAESVEIPSECWNLIEASRAAGGKIWALGTTVARSLEAATHGRLSGSGGTGFQGETDIFIRPGHEWRMVDRLLTNFHQPRSTLLALVAAFAGLETVRRAYRLAIEKEFRLFSYGDLSVWTRGESP